MPSLPPPPTWTGVLVRFGEIGIKSAPVRRQMAERLRRNLEDGLERDRIEGGVARIGSRLWMTGPDAARLVDVACRTFGVVSASPCIRVPATMEAMGDAAAALALAEPWTTFAIRARREGKHSFTSQDIGIQVGSAVFAAAAAAGRTPKVDLTKPDFAVEVDVRQDKAFLFANYFAGPGGLPIGSQGTVAALVSDEASFVAAWLMMRRGCNVIPIHAGTTGSLETDAAAALARWGMPPDVEVLPICAGTVAKPVLLEAAARVAAQRRAIALVTGETIESSLVAASIPVLRPVCGLVRSEYERWRTRIGLVPFASNSILDAASTETVDSVLSLHRTVTQ